ncbi:pyocin knob domain-containing protein [Lentilactobacillus buchneri]|uniref:pyocin knob domain-containing protein n=1 Tax=Lentilactobacillus buchneri TaxID=1581 RepID=UPI001781267A|nr:pyocin knob domain-containing protein [Lentilactobacillus buchneri]
MQKMGDTIITDLGMDLLSSVNNGDDKITYTKTVLAADNLTQESDVDIQKTTSLKLIQQTTGTTVISRVDNTVNLGATFTNKEVTQNFDFYVIGWYAKGSAVITDERLFAITPSTVKQTMPAGKDGAATAAISPKYASALSRSATVSLNPDQAGTVTPEYVDQKIQQIISEGIVNAGSTLSESDNLDSFITTGYHLIKGSLPLSAPEGFSTNGQIIVYGNKDTTDGVTQVAYDDINGTSYVRSYNPTNNQWSTWDLIITKSQLNAVLPTDIARTGETNEFKAKNTFDVDPVNKDGNSYGLAKDIDTKVTDNGDNSIEINKQAITPVRDNKDGSINFNGKHMTPADDSKVVHTSDMRKPANDVAGIEEVNAKQDKIGYTPADDSKVVHNSAIDPSVMFKRLLTADDDVLMLDSGIYCVWGGPTPKNYPTNVINYARVVVKNFSANDINTGNTIVEVFDAINNHLINIYQGSPMKWSGWQVPNSNIMASKSDVTTDITDAMDGTVKFKELAEGTDLFSMLVTDGKSHFYACSANATATTLKNSPANCAFSLELYPVNIPQGVASNGVYKWDYTQMVLRPINSSTAWLASISSDDSGNITHTDWVQVATSTDLSTGLATKADDSKVAHLSGANNFDTVPTVNNNPLLLASSLPTDLARTGSDQEFTGKNTFDTAPIDKATGNPYITKDGVPAVPSTLADTTKPANFTAGLQSGGVSVATSDDLKSVEESAWRELDLSGTSGIYTGKILIKIDQANKYIYFIMNAQVPLNAYTKGTKIIDLSSVVTGLSSAHGYFQGWINDLENPYSIVGSTMVASGSSIELGNDYSRIDSDGVSRIATEADPGKQYCYVTYDSLVN